MSCANDFFLFPHLLLYHLPICGADSLSACTYHLFDCLSISLFMSASLCSHMLPLLRVCVCVCVLYVVLWGTLTVVLREPPCQQGSPFSYTI